jgi:hypothetical protein
MRTLLLLLASVASAAASAVAQDRAGVAYSSPTYFLTAIEFGSGEEADSVQHKLRPVLSTGVVAEPDSGSATYFLRGGFPAMLTSSTMGTPMLAGVTPFFVGQDGSQRAVVSGYDMLRGGAPTVTVGGQPATVTQSTTDHVTVEVPNQPVPGFQPVTLTNGLGTVQLERGVAVVPMMFNREPLNIATPVHSTLVATQGDLVVLGLSFGRLPGPVPLLGARYGLLLDPNLLFATALIRVTEANGTYVLTAPPLPVVGQTYVQALVITTNPTYAPWSWTNDVTL